MKWSAFLMRDSRGLRRDDANTVSPALSTWRKVLRSMPYQSRSCWARDLCWVSYDVLPTSSSSTALPLSNVTHWYTPLVSPEVTTIALALSAFDRAAPSGGLRYSWTASQFRRMTIDHGWPTMRKTAKHRFVSLTLRPSTSSMWTVARRRRASAAAAFSTGASARTQVSFTSNVGTPVGRRAAASRAERFR